MNRLATALFETGTNANESEVQESTVESARLPRDRHHLALLTSAQRQLKAGDRLHSFSLTPFLPI